MNYYDEAEEVSLSAEYPEFSEAAHAMEAAGKSIALSILPLQKKIAECTVKCFPSSSMFSASSFTAAQGEEISRCIEKCESSAKGVEGVIDEERNELIKGSVECMQKCPEGDNNCYKACVTDWMSSKRIDNMVERVRGRIRGLI